MFHIFPKHVLPFVVLLIASATLSEEVCKGDTEPNHIILFFVDDFGQQDLSCYGSRLYETPYMDQLAAEGMKFTNAYAAYSRCVPSRQGLLSGKYPCRIENESIRSGDHKHHLPLTEVTFGEAFRDSGYRTCYIGKWHLGKDGGGPGDQGFETIVHSGSAGATGNFFYPFGTEKGLTVQNPVDGMEGDYLTDRLTDKAVEYISANKDQQFLMVLAHYAVHTPIQAPEEITKKYQRKLRQAGIEVGGKKDDADFVRDRQGMTKTVQNNPTYAAMVEKTDRSLGRIMQALQDSGISKNTAIILTSDHGGLSTRGLTKKRAIATSNLPLRQGKGSIFEGGTRVPLIVKWPGRIEAGSTSISQVMGTDHYPTMLDIANLPPRPQQHVDGRSYLKALEGKTYQRDAMFWYKWQARPDSTGDTRALSMIEGRYKIVQWIDEDLVELFDLTSDVGEQTNLASQMPELANAMLTRLLATENDIGNLRAKGLKERKRRLKKSKN
ncbi:MAG: sulfatase [Fuerstiella sp.]